MFAFLLLAAVGGATAWSLLGAARAYAWIEHTYRVIGTLQDYRAAVRGAESASRGYRLTGSTSMHDEFTALAPVIDAELVELAMLVADNPVQAGRMHELRLLTAHRMLLSRQVQEARDATSAIVAGATVMARIQDLTGAMLQTERALLQERQAQGQSRQWLLLGFTIGGTLAALLLLSLLLRSLQRENRRTRELETQARSAAIGLEDSLTQLSAISEQRAALGRYVGLLQSCGDAAEALRVTGHVIAELLPGSGGRCYLLRASQDYAETAIVFGVPAAPSLDMLQPPQCWGLRRGQPYPVDDLRRGVLCDHLAGHDAAAGAWSLCVPLLAQGTPLGLLHVSSTRAAGRQQAQALVESIAEQLSLALVNLQLRDTLRMQSLRDPLTGLFNRRYLDESLPRELTRCLRRGLPLAVMMIDVDHFKAFNDTHGHAAGDALLTAIGHAIQSLTRNEDLACRYGGEEFTVVLVEANADDALRRAEEIRAAIGATTARHLRQELGPCTASIGLAMLPVDGQAPAALLQEADAALYRAKTAGRNRVERASRAPALT